VADVSLVLGVVCAGRSDRGPLPLIVLEKSAASNVRHGAASYEGRSHHSPRLDSRAHETGVRAHARREVPPPRVIADRAQTIVRGNEVKQRAFDPRIDWESAKRLRSHDSNTRARLS
jgi:hypothetical protein